MSATEGLSEIEGLREFESLYVDTGLDIIILLKWPEGGLVEHDCE